MPWITPKTDWLPTEYINADDFNRIESNIMDVSNYLRIVGYTIPVFTTVMNRTNKSYDDLASINRIENNLETIRENTSTPFGWQAKKTWGPGDGFTYKDANRLENNTRLLRNIIKSQIYKSYTRLSDFNNTEFQYSMPTNTYYHDSRMHYVIDKAELIGMGLAAGDLLTGISFYIDEVPGRDISKFTIALAHTDKSTADLAKPFNEFSLVYSADEYKYSFTADKWKDISFTTPFTWDGVSNVLVCLIKDGSSYTTGGRVRYVNVRPNIVSGFFNDSQFLYPFDNRDNRIVLTNYVPDMMITANKV